MAVKIGELFAVTGGELEEGNLIVVHPGTMVAVAAKPTRDGAGPTWTIPVEYFKPGPLGMPVPSGRDTINTHKPVVKVVYDDAAAKDAGLDVD